MPLAKSWLDWEEAAGGRAILKGTPEEIKGMYDQLVQALIPMMPAPNENVDVVEGDVDGIKYRTYTPKGNDHLHCLDFAMWY
jgi:versiconal hemiacetal acetate esterase